jgi:hypothetical protein
VCCCIQGGDDSRPSIRRHSGSPCMLTRLFIRARFVDPLRALPKVSRLPYDPFASCSHRYSVPESVEVGVV